MRMYLTLPALALATLLGFRTGHVQAGKFFGSANYAADSSYPYPNRARNSFDYGPGSPYQTRQPHFRHRLFHRDQGVANQGMPANALPGYGMTPYYQMPFEYGQAPLVQSPALTPPVQMTSGVPSPTAFAPAVQSPSCRKCAQSARAPVALPAAPAVQSRLVPIPTSMPSRPVTSEPPLADPTARAPF